jgi:NRPS condensation-like uncharacterized protein
LTAPSRRIPFTAVDELGDYFDRWDEPNNVHLEAAVSGHLDPARLRASVLHTLAHPMARVRRAPGGRWDRRPAWEIAPQPDVETVSHVRWTSEHQLAAHRQQLMATAPVLDLAPPLRVCHASGPNEDVLILNAHHAAFDGMSCLWLLRSIAHHYAGRPDPVPIDPVPARSPASSTARADRRRTSYRRPARVAGERSLAAPGYGFRLLTLRLRPGTTPKPTGTVNDVLLASLALAIASWNARHAERSGIVRITMPINARVDEPDALGNLSRLAVVVSDHEDRSNPDRLLASTTRQTVEAKRSAGAQIDPLSRALVAPWLPVATKARLVRAARRLGSALFSDTSMLSNIGAIRDPLDFGAAHPLTGMWFSAPAPMPRGLSVGAITVHDQLRLCFRYRRALFDDDAAARFAGLFADTVAAIGDPRFGDPPPGGDPP